MQMQDVQTPQSNKLGLQDFLGLAQNQDSKTTPWKDRLQDAYNN